MGFAQGVFSSEASDVLATDSESVVELHYSLQIASWAGVGRSVQYGSHPGGNGDVNDAVIVGFCAQIVF